MTQEKYNKATEIQKKIQYLNGLVEMLESHEGDKSPFRMTDFSIKDSKGAVNLVNFEIPVLLLALHMEMRELESMFERL